MCDDEPAASIGQHRRSKWSIKEEETSLLGQNKNKSMIINKIKGWPQATQPIMTNKNDNNQQGQSPTVHTTATSKNNKDCHGQQQLTAPHTPQVPLSPPPGKPPPTKTGRLIQPNNLLKVLTANVQSLLPEIDELIALIQVENFEVIALNEIWLDTQNKHLLAEVSIHGYKVFHVDKPTPSGRGGGSIMYYYYY